MEVIRAKHPNVKIFCGGPQCLPDVAKSLIERNLIDAAVFGEGEQTTSELLKMWNSSEEIRELGGAMININRIAVRGPERPLMDINTVPDPDFSEFPMYTYDQYGSLPIYCSRGCVAKCSFCSETIYWKKFRALHPEKIVAMIERAQFNYGINSFYFNDSLMNGSHKLLEETCDLIIEKNLQIEFSGYSRFDAKLTPDLMYKLSKAGCKSISFGFESGSQKVVDLMNKKVFVGNYEQILKVGSQLGIGCNVCIIVGFPGESWADYFATLKKVIKMRKSILNINLSIMEITKNSLIESDFSKYKIINSHHRYWRTSDWSNIYLFRYIRYYIFKMLWKIISGRKVSIGNWEANELNLIGTITSFLKFSNEKKSA
jgi:radical SAM superfamily enzyme YgiQ (UPF0313 family)